MKGGHGPAKNVQPCISCTPIEVLQLLLMVLLLSGLIYFCCTTMIVVGWDPVVTRFCNYRKGWGGGGWECFLEWYMQMHVWEEEGGMGVRDFTIKFS